MKFNRKKLDAVLGELRNEKYTGTNGEVLHAYVGEEYRKFVEFCKAAPRTEEETKKALESVRYAVNLYNDEMRCERIDQFLDMKPKEAMEEYLRNQNVTGLRIDNDKDMGPVINTDEKVELDAYDFVAALCPLGIANILDTVCIFADSLARFSLKGVEGVTMNSMHAGYIEMRNRLAEKNPDVWDVADDKLSKRKLAAQLTEICRMISFGMAPEMLNPDVVYLEKAICVAKSVSNEAGKIQIRDEKTILRFVFRAMYTRYNKLAYDFQNTTRSGSEAPRSTGANKVMAENPKSAEFSPVDMPKAGPVTVSKGKTKKSAKKDEKAE